jgi:hypothetical protein
MLGYTFYTEDGTILWKSHKQAIFLLCSMAAQYQSLSNACKEALWLCHLLTKLHLGPEILIPLYVDNEGTESLPRAYKIMCKPSLSTPNIISSGNVSETKRSCYTFPLMKCLPTCKPSHSIGPSSRKTVNSLAWSDLFHPNLLPIFLPNFFLLSYFSFPIFSFLCSILFSF